MSTHDHHAHGHRQGHGHADEQHKHHQHHPGEGDNHLGEMEIRVRAIETLLTEKGLVEPAAMKAGDHA